MKTPQNFSKFDLIVGTIFMIYTIYYVIFKRHNINLQYDLNSQIHLLSLFFNMAYCGVVLSCLKTQYRNTVCLFICVCLLLVTKLFQSDPNLREFALLFTPKQHPSIRPNRSRQMSSFQLILKLSYLTFLLTFCKCILTKLKT